MHTIPDPVPAPGPADFSAEFSASVPEPSAGRRRFLRMAGALPVVAALPADGEAWPLTVRAETGVQRFALRPVTGIDPAAVGGAQVARVEVPGAAAQHSFLA